MDISSLAMIIFTLLFFSSHGIFTENKISNKFINVVHGFYHLTSNRRLASWFQFAASKNVLIVSIFVHYTSITKNEKIFICFMVLKNIYVIFKWIHLICNIFSRVNQSQTDLMFVSWFYFIKTVSFFRNYRI